MNKFLELTLADGNALDIPANSIFMMEEMTAETNENFPEARSFILYKLGKEVRTGILSTSLSDLFYHTDVNVSPVKWLKLTYKHNGLRVVLQAHNILSRLAREDGCELTLLIGDEQRTIAVNESRDQIKELTEGPLELTEETE